MVRRIRRDVPTENSSIYTHGHLKKLDGVVTNYMSGIGTWEPISGAATLPAPPDKSVQFNDGLTAFGGSAFFLFDKTKGRVSLGNTSSLGTESITLQIQSNHDYSIKCYGEDTLVYNVGCAGWATEPSSFGGTGAANPSTSCLVGNDNNANTFAFRSKSGNATARNLVEGKFEVLGHSHFGNVGQAFGDQTSVASVLGVGENFSGNLSAGTYSTISAASTYDPSAGTPSINECSVNAIANTGNFTNVEALVARVDLNSGAVAQSLFGGVGLSQSASGSTVTEHAVGLSGEINMAGNVTGADYVAAVQAIVTTTTVPLAYGFYSGVVTGGTLNYGVFVSEIVAAGYNIWSDHTGATPGQGKNFLGSGAQIGATDLNISRFAANILGIGTGAEGNVSGKLRAAAAGLGGNISGTEVLTMAGNGSASGYWDAASYKVGGAAGASGNFTTVDLKTVTVVNGIVTSIA